MKNKFKTFFELKTIVNTLQAQNKKVVFANGCFDILHVGHIRYLKAAKELGDFLIVAINSDKSVKLIKGNNRPLMTESERIEIISAVECVDAVIIFNNKTVDNLLKELKPDIHAKGTDYTRENVPERDVVYSYGGKVAIVGDKKTHSTRDIIRLIKRNCG